MLTHGKNIFKYACTFYMIETVVIFECARFISEIMWFEPLNNSGMSRKRSVPEPSFSFGVNVLRLNQTFDHLDNEEDRASNEINDIDWEDTSNLLFHNVQDTMSDLDELTVISFFFRIIW